MRLRPGKPTNTAAGRLPWRVLAAILLLAGIAAAQQEVHPHLIGGRRDLAPGIKAAQFSRLKNRTMNTGQSVAIDSQIGDARVEIAVSPHGVWDSAKLGDILSTAQANAGMTLWRGSEPLEPLAPEGFLFTQGALLGWPPKSPVLRAATEGTFELLDLSNTENQPAVIRADNGTSITLAAINGFSPDGAVLISGQFNSSLREVELWPEGTLTVPIHPASKNRAPNSSIWETRPVETRRWEPEFSRPLKHLQLDVDKWAIVLPPTLDPITRAGIASANSLEIHVPLDPETALSLFTVEVGTWFLRNGKRVNNDATDPNPDIVRSFLAVDQTRRLLYLGSFGGDQPGQTSPASEDIATQLLDKGFDDAVELPREYLRLHPGEIDINLAHQRSDIPTRVALVTATTPVRLATGSENDLVKWPVAAATGSNATISIDNAPLKLFDGAIGFRNELNHFWAAELPDDAPRQWVEFRLGKTGRVGALDFLHAETCGFSRQFNLKAFRLLGRAQSSESWRELAVVRHTESAARERVELPNAPLLDQIRLEIIEPNFLPGSQTVRLGEIVVWGKEP